MTEKEKSIYTKLYDISSENLKSAGMSMSTHKETLVASLDLKPDVTDLSIMYDVGREKYLQVLFYITFKRWIEEDEIKKIDGRNLDDKEFKKEVLKAVYDSTERRIKKCVVSNYVDTSNEYTYSVGKFKRRIRMTITKIKAKIPLKTKQKIKNIYLKIMNR